MNTNNNRVTNDGKGKLSNEQKQKMKKYAVFALMGIICSGCIWFIFAPSAEDKARQGQQSGFNSEIPDPDSEGIVGDKRTAYEQEQMRQKQEERMRSLEDFSSLLGESNPKGTDGLALLPDETAVSKSSNGYSVKPTPVQNSVNAYRDINRTLGNFYETPKEDSEKEELKRQVEELQARMNETDSRKNAVDEQVALMEKSFRMAQKYLPVNTGTTAGASSTGEQQTTNSGTNISGKTAVVSVSQVAEQTVSALPQEMSGKYLMQAFAKPRNLGFFTATAEISKEHKNTISACIYENQTLMDGKSVRLRLSEPMQAGKMLIRENTLLSGFAKIQGERLQITVSSLEYNGNIIPVELAVYDTDGQRGIFIPDTKEINAVKEVAANMGTTAGTGISLSGDAGEQFAADMGRNVIQGISQFFSKKMTEVKVSIKAGYKVLLAPPNLPKGEA
jgi:conjugative transposon TraM protein